jgi:hypothetical protein
VLITARKILGLTDNVDVLGFTIKIMAHNSGSEISFLVKLKTS